MSKELDIEFEKAVRMLAENMPISDVDSRKPVLSHDIRVGVYLLENDYSREIVLAGLLHDATEWSKITEDMIRGEFGDEVVEIVLACTKDDSIKDPEDRNEDMVKKCVRVGEDALIVKAADIIDSFKFYTKEKNEDQLVNHCQEIAGLILKHKPDDFDDRIFNELSEYE